MARRRPVPAPRRAPVRASRDASRRRPGCVASRPAVSPPPPPPPPRACDVLVMDVCWIPRATRRRRRRRRRRRAALPRGDVGQVGRNALHLAAAGGHADVVAALLLAGCDVNVTDGAGCTALQHAAADGHLEVVRQLIQHGADVNHQDSVHGNTALHEASWKGFSRSVAALGRARAHLHLKNCGGFAALHLCCQNGHNQSCRELLLAGCSPNLQNNVPQN
ncbi:Ankyrin repeat and KH domain-containing protein mask [Gryllus bimaculatus]|nr:Ankyrin repeat and KH domain-containing protein mask [Gryllus bimaculatus]